MAGQVSEELIIAIRTQVEQAVKSLKSVQDSLDATTQGAVKTARATDTMASQMVRRAKQIVGAYVGFKTLLEGIKFNAFIEQTRTAFSVMIGSAALASAKVEELLQFSLRIPLTFKETIGAARQLLAYGFSAEELTKQLRMLGDVATAIGAPLGDIAYIYGTLRTQGRAYARDLMQFGMRGIPIYQELARVLGKNVTQIQKLTEEGKVGFKEVEKAFQNMTGVGGQFGGLMEKLMGTLTGAWNQFRGILEIVLGDFTKGISAQITPVLRDLSAWLLQNRKDFEILGNILAGLFRILVELTKALWNLRIPLAAITALWAATQVNGILTATVALVDKLTMALYGVLGASRAVVASIAVISAPFVAAAAIVWQLRNTLADAAISLAQFFGLSTEEATRQRLALGLLTEATQKLYDTQADVGVTMFLDNQKKIREELEKQKAAEDALRNEFEKFLDAYNKYLAERARDEQGNITAVAEYERMKQEKLALEKLGTSKRLYNEALRMIREQYAYEEQQLRKQAEYKRIEISREVTGYATILEQQETAMMYEEQAFVAMGSKNRALAQEYAKRKVALEQLQAAVAEEELRVQYGLQLNVSADNTLELLKKQHPALAADERAWKAITKAIQDIPIREKLEKLAESLENQLDRSRDFSDRLELINKLYNNRINIINLMLDPEKREIENAKAVYEWNQATTEELTRQYDLLVKGNDEYFARLKAQAMEQIKAGNLGGAVSSAAQVGLQGTQVGTLMSAGPAGAGASAMLQLVSSVVEAASSFDVLRDILNPFAVVAKAIFSILGPILSTVLKPLVSLLKVFGNILGAVTYVFLAMTPILKVLQFALETVANAFRWFYNSIIVPVGNAIIGFTNAIIDGINFLLGWLGVHIDHLDYLVEIVDNVADDLETAQERLQAVNDALDYLKNKLREAVDAQVKSLQDLYEVGALTASQYESQVQALNDTYGVYFMDDLELQYSQLTTLTQILNAIKALLGEQQTAEQQVASQQLLAAGKSIAEQITSSVRSVGPFGALPKFAEIWNKLAEDQRKALASFLGVPDERNWIKIWEELVRKGYIPNATLAQEGIGKVPKDMPAFLHKNETVVPPNFAEAIRRGELTLGSSSDTRQLSGDVYYITIEGSVIEERDLADTISKAITRQGKRGYAIVN